MKGLEMDTHSCNFLKVEPDALDDTVHIPSLIKTPQPPRERDLTKNVKHKVLDPLKEIHIDALIGKQLVQAGKEKLHGRRHQRFQRKQTCH